MSEYRALRDFSEEVLSDVTDRVANLGPFQGHSSEDAALAETCIELLEEVGSTSDAVLCPYADADGRNRCRISGYAISEAESRLDLFGAIYVEGSQQTLPQRDLMDVCGRAARFFDYAIKKDWSRLKGSPETLEAARRIHSKRSELERVRVVIFTNGLLTQRDVQDIDIAGIPVEFSVYDLERLYRLSKTTTSRSDIVIDFEKLCGRPLPCLEVKPRPKEYETYLAIFNGDLLFRLYEQYSQQLFEFNVRSFLQVKGKINAGIRDTLKTEPERFMAYNNGLVATVDEIEIGLFCGETVIKRIVGLQIVNGAQTTASIHRAKKHDRMDISAVSVPVKITKVQPDKLTEFVPLISRYANTQNNIQVSDLSANHNFHIELERLSEVVWAPGEETRWFYERARGAYAVALAKAGTTAAQRRQFKEEIPPSHKISKTDLARDLMAWLGRPHTVGLGTQKTFAIFMAELPELFPAEWKPDEEYYRQVVSRAILYRAAKRVVLSEKFPAYGANIVAYSVAYLAHSCKGQLNFSMIWEAQDISQELRMLLREWSHKINDVIRRTAEGRNVTEWCKKTECWDAIRGLKLVVSGPMPPEILEAIDDEQEISEAPTSLAANQHKQWDDQERIEACMRLDPSTWAKISFWGLSSGRLTRVERGVAHTLSEYAAANWSKRPSEKQARVGARIIDIAIGDGIIKANVSS